MATVADIPINQHLGITYSKETKNLELAPDARNNNYFGTTSFCAQFTLAEAASAQYMIDNLGITLETSIPTLRNAETKFYKPTEGKSVTELASISHTKKQFQDILNTKGRISIKVVVSVFGEGGQKALKSTFSWLVVRL